ncbi:2-hydroxy-3-keto-5-methylthiopentenyl-1-phosphate phosphatase [Paenibacillus sp. GCM10027626]|uniref:2-hydroxy-3-keto-5-methylthiopentenyl-1- phosphate phosphatase n=1 Tax=Paenibacillus sp. GCM10027626 TaxID=3273411 RepID=UPI00362779B3
MMTERLGGRRRQPIIFCDFDGTITQNDNIIAIIRHFNPPGWEALVDEIIGERKSIKEGVGELFRLLPVTLKQEMTDFVIGNASIRAGFQELLDYCRKQEIEFYVTSGGIDFFVYPLLAPYGIPQNHIYCNGSDFSGPQVEITWPHACDDHCHNNCGMCKSTIIRRFPKEQYKRILIGDSVTDFEGAKLADLVFARSHLTTKCTQLGLPHFEYITFHDVIAILKQEENND